MNHPIRGVPIWRINYVNPNKQSTEWRHDWIPFLWQVKTPDMTLRSSIGSRIGCFSIDGTFKAWNCWLVAFTQRKIDPFYFSDWCRFFWKFHTSDKHAIQSQLLCRTNTSLWLQFDLNISHLNILHFHGMNLFASGVLSTEAWFYLRHCHTSVCSLD